MFNLHVVQALFGDSLVIEFGKADDKKYILIDGGPDKVYSDYLSSELKKIVKTKKLEATSISHIDTDHIKGVLDFFVDLKKADDNDKKRFVEPGKLIFNTFSESIDPGQVISSRLMNMMSLMGVMNVMSESAIVVNSIKEGHRVTSFAKSLGMKVNPNSNNGLYISEKKPQKLKFGSLALTVVGPTQDNLDALKKDWEKWLDKNEAAISAGKMDIAAMADKSVPNLSSIVFLAEAEGKSILLTGDARGDFILDGLELCGLKKKNKAFEVDVLKVPHHGSRRNVDKKFFETIIADTYVISADGKYDNPDYDTLEWIVQAAKQDNRTIDLIITNSTPSTKKLLKAYPPAKWNYTMSHIEQGKNSFALKL